MSILIDKGFTIEVTYPEIADWYYGIALAEDAEIRREQVDNPEVEGDYNEDPFETDRVYVFTYRHPLIHPSVGVIPIQFDENGVAFNPWLEAPGQPGGGGGTPGTVLTPNLNQVATVGNFTDKVLDIGGFSIPDVPNEQLLDAYDGWIVAKRDGARMQGKLASFLAVLKALINGLNSNVAYPDLLKPALKLTLADLSVLDSLNNIYLYGEGEFLRGLPDGAIGGLSTLRGTTRTSRFGDFGADGVGFIDGAGRQVRYVEDTLKLDGGRIEAKQSNLVARTMAVTTLPRATKTPTMILVLEQDAVSGEYILKVASPTQINDATLPDLSTRLPQQGDSQGDQFELEGCFTRYVKPSTNQKFAITPDMIGVPQPHNLQVAGALIYPILLDINNKPDAIMDLSFQGIETFTINYPEGVSSGYEGGKLSIETIAP